MCFHPAQRGAYLQIWTDGASLDQAQTLFKTKQQRARKTSLQMLPQTGATSAGKNNLCRRLPI